MRCTTLVLAFLIPLAVAFSMGCAHERTTSALALTDKTAIGTWTLTDSENTTFDVIIDPDGSAISNWSKGPTKAQGEQGSWKIERGRLVIDYTDGWRDVVVPTHDGHYAKEGFAPGAARDGAATNIGFSARTSDADAQWVGVYEIPEGLSSGSTSFFVAIQSSHTAWKSIDTPNVGSWWIKRSALRIRWANGWLDELTPSGNGYTVRSWEPGTPLDFTGEPTVEPTSEGVGKRFRVGKP